MYVHQIVKMLLCFGDVQWEHWQYCALTDRSHTRVAVLFCCMSTLFHIRGNTTVWYC
jgi:hypothetical protein